MPEIQNEKWLAPSTNERVRIVVDNSEGSGSTDVIAMTLEIVFGLFGILGLGWAYAGNFLTAVSLFVGYLALVFLELFIVFTSLGCCAFLVPPLNISIVIVSGIRVRDYIQKTKAKGSMVFLIAAAAVIVVVLCMFLFPIFIYNATVIAEFFKGFSDNLNNLSTP